MTQDVCECIEKVQPVTFDSYEECMDNISKKYIIESMELIDTTSSLEPYEQGQIIGRKIFILTQNNLVHNCDTFYDFVKKMHEWSYQKLKEETLIKDSTTIDSIKLISRLNPTEETLFESGIVYFAEGNYNQAEENFMKSIEIEEDYVPSYMFLAWTYDRMGKLNESIKFYELFIEMTGSEEIGFFLEKVRRKDKEG